MQTSYDFYQKAGFAGMIADNGRIVDIVSYAAEAGMNPAVPVIPGTDPEKQVKAVSVAGDGAKIVGVVVFQHKEQTEAAYYPATYPVPVMKKGRIWVETAGAVTAQATANVVLATGKFTTDAVATGIEAVGIGAKFITSTDAAGLAVVELG